MIIDAHVHIGNLPGSGRRPFREVRDDLLASMQENGIEAAIVIQRRHKDGEHSPADAELLGLLSGFPKLHMVATINPLSATLEDWRALEALCEQGVACGLKLYPGYQPFSPADQSCEPVYALARRYALPVIVHCGDVYVTRGDELLKYADPLAVDEAATRHCDVNFVIAHLGNPWIDSCAAVLYKNENVFADVSGLFTARQGMSGAYQALLLRKIHDLIAYAGAQRLLFGSDWPIADHATCLQFAKSIDIPPALCEAFWSGTAARLFKIDV